MGNIADFFTTVICSLCTQIPRDYSVVSKDALQEGWNRKWEFYWKVVAVLGWVLFQNNMTCDTSLAIKSNKCSEFLSFEPHQWNENVCAMYFTSFITQTLYN